jgi:hypothetical protein
LRLDGFRDTSDQVAHGAGDDTGVEPEAGPPGVSNISRMPSFICPNCGNRLSSGDRTEGFRNKARGCQRCGFAFLFELLDDYYPDPNAAFFVCDREARVIGCGKGSFELTGLDDEKAVGRPVREVLGLSFENGEDPIGTSLEWGVRVMGKTVRVVAEGDMPAEATADVFPAYDEDGGLMLVLTPKR